MPAQLAQTLRDAHLLPLQQDKLCSSTLPPIREGLNLQKQALIILKPGATFSTPPACHLYTPPLSLVSSLGSHVITKKSEQLTLHLIHLISIPTQNSSALPPLSLLLGVDWPMAPGSTQTGTWRAHSNIPCSTVPKLWKPEFKHLIQNFLYPHYHEGGKTRDLGRRMGDGGERGLRQGVQDWDWGRWRGCGKEDVY
jgi:hypothetical protein